MLAQESSDARKKLSDLEARSRAMQTRSHEEQARYAKEMGAAQKQITDLEAMMRRAKVEADAALRAAMEVSTS